MSLQLRVLIEVGPSEVDQVMARVDQAETVIPVNDDPSDIAALADVALVRMVEDCTGKFREQLGQLGSVMETEVQAL